MQHLAAQWQAIDNELQALQSRQFSPWPEAGLYVGEWSVFAMYAFGQKVQEGAGQCPRTVTLVEQVPGMITAGFSRLTPGTHIRPHVGYTDKVLRFHLGLTQAKDCALRVGNQTRTWSPGSAFVFNDTVEHEAWNRGTLPRIILLLDFALEPSESIAFPDFATRYFGNGQ